MRKMQFVDWQLILTIEFSFKLLVLQVSACRRSDQLVQEVLNRLHTIKYMLIISNIAELVTFT